LHYETACRLAYYASKDRTKSSQISQLIEKLDEKSGKESLNNLKVHILYQLARDIFGKKTGKELLKSINDIESSTENHSRAQASVRELLLNFKMLFKVFEAENKLSKNEENKSFENLVNNFIELSK